MSAEMYWPVVHHLHFSCSHEKTERNLIFDTSLFGTARGETLLVATCFSVSRQRRLSFTNSKGKHLFAVTSKNAMWNGIVRTHWGVSTELMEMEPTPFVNLPQVKCFLLVPRLATIRQK